MSEITIYTTSTCPKCELLKQALKESGVIFKTTDMSTPEALTELRVNGVFTLTAPVLQIDEEFLTHEELFNGMEVKREVFENLL
ncbi:MAG: glutaredoxin domain-containing protein [Methanomethylovorans sp.]|uniref:glutaredoxin family protein n=1 Tax=Methanomethylovorans sp. TaxID=2758717 RepID=UPI000ACE2F47|nr:glutaredoxin domain-containing protein [Methanomethylovorans sp.]